MSTPAISGIVVGAVVLIVIFVLVVVVVIRRKKNANKVPKDHRVNWPLEETTQAVNSSSTRQHLLPNDFSYFLDREAGKDGFVAEGLHLEKVLVPGTVDYERFAAVFEQVGGVGMMNFDAIESVTAVYNPDVAVSFVSYNKSLARKIAADPHLFNKNDWEKKDRQELRKWVRECLTKKVQLFPWNTGGAEFPKTPVIAAVHGTDSPTARKIIENGFATLSAVDVGYYGAGMYFSTEADYIQPYFATKQSPSLLICFVTPGNAFPIVESRNEKDGFLGSPLVSGYQSHYVNVTIKGQPCTSVVRKDYYDELVLVQEAQVLPAYLVVFKRDKMLAYSNAFVKYKSALPDVSARSEFNLGRPRR